MGEMPIATCPGQIVGIDLMGPPFQSNLHNNKYICVIIDHYSGWVEAYPLSTKANEGIWERMANDYVPRHGAPQILISDQGSEFRGPWWVHSTLLQIKPPLLSVNPDHGISCFFLKTMKQLTSPSTIPASGGQIDNFP